MMTSNFGKSDRADPHELEANRYIGTAGQNFQDILVDVRRAAMSNGGNLYNNAETTAGRDSQPLSQPGIGTVANSALGPGAHPVGAPGSAAPISRLEEDIVRQDVQAPWDIDGSVQFTTENFSSLEFNNGLVQARRVSSEFLTGENDLPRAEMVDTQVDLQERERKKHFLYMALPFSLCVLLLAVVAIVLLLLENDSSSAVPGFQDDKHSNFESGNFSSDAAWSWDLPFSIPNSTLHALVQDPFGNVTPQSQAYEWMIRDPYLNNYPKQRLRQRFAMAVLYYATMGEEWSHQGGGVVTILTDSPDILGGSNRNNGQGGGNNGGHGESNRRGQGGHRSLGPGWSRMLHGGTAVPCQANRGLQQGANGSRGEQTAQAKPGSMGELNITSEPWLSSVSECNWYSTAATRRSGVCNQNGTLVFLGIMQNNLQGTLPLEVGLLSSLEVLELARNSIRGTIPTGIFALSNLRQLTLHQNQLTGTLPREVGLLSNTLTWVTLLSNELTGTVPQELYMLSKLTQLQLGDTRLIGPIPSNIGFRFPQLKVLQLNRSPFRGSLPSTIGLMTALTQLGLHETRLSATLPTELGGCTRLKQLLGKKNNISGTLPSELGLLTRMQTINLEGNPGLNGCIPKALGAINNTLLAFKISGTAMTGTVPHELVA
ncbi:leucine Rich Repeat [Seminavis robusta]|uniref:Leucine Rich Repeat n=1 Tax=Seminavis robusta TaxID=568900 RepID=A0A9N8D415_9STRA|nr:leucine Rich Repeat [Seminavis robusta]|eukprot:Sro1_g000010.1 leucine Rich Repeat (657) ;mRNA; r:2289-4678